MKKKDIGMTIGAALLLMLAVGSLAQTLSAVEDRPRPLVEKLATPLIEQRIKDATGHTAKCRLDENLWAAVTAGVKYEGMVTCVANNTSFHTHIFVTRYNDSDDHMYWEIGNIRRTDASMEAQ
jgi:hypothetical protein